PYALYTLSLHDALPIYAFEAEGADAWYAAGARERFLGKLSNEPSASSSAVRDADVKGPWQKIDDILDVWFDSGSTHAFTLEVREDRKSTRLNSSHRTIS